MVQTDLARAFPRDLRADVEAVRPCLSLEFGGTWDSFSVTVRGEALWIPYRLYRLVPDPDLSGMSLSQHGIAQCLLTRSEDGYVRQKALQGVLRLGTAWSMPYIVALAGEYVIEIIRDLHAATPHINRDELGAFLRANPAFWKLTRDRVMSYWNVYYRSQATRHDYIGVRLLDEWDTLA